jgi:hypothetical protein
MVMLVKGAIFSGAHPRQKSPRKLRKNRVIAPSVLPDRQHLGLNVGRLPAIAVAVHWPPAIFLLVAQGEAPQITHFPGLKPSVGVSGFCRGAAPAKIAAEIARLVAIFFKAVQVGRGQSPVLVKQNGLPPMHPGKSRDSPQGSTG